MDVIESIKKDRAYVKCKLIVKNWEKEFKVNHSRTPSKFDIKEAPAKIKYAYKKYFQLKSSALENSLSICDYEEENLASPEIPPSFANVAADSPSPMQPDLPALPSGQELEKLLSDTKTKVIPENFHPFTENLSKKLFNNRSFTLRNPRKLSLNKCQSSIESKCKESIDSTETMKASSNSIIMNKEPINSQCNLFPTNNLSNSTIINTASVRQFNSAWLNRAAGLNIQAETYESVNNSNAFGISNINIPKQVEVSNISIQSSDLEDDIPLGNLKSNINVKDNFDYIENSESEDENIAITKLKPALKKRKLENVTNITQARHKEVDYEDNTLKKKVSLKKSNNEKQNKSGRKQKVSKHTKKTINTSEQHPPDIAEYVSFGVERDIVPRHTQLTNVLKTNSINKKVVNREDTGGAMDKLENKIKNGTLNDNFVKINIEKKVFVRGKKGMNFSKYKKQQWKNKKALHASMEFPENGKISCFKCGQSGHMARYCTAHKGETLLPLENYEESDIPTLEDMQKLAAEETSEVVSVTEQLSQSIFEPSQIPDSFMQLLAKPSSNEQVQPIYFDLNSISIDDLNDALVKFGHKSFRPGQEEAIKRILCGMSTLLILSTGGGKSLCYQLPAYIYSKHYKCITLVISPLVSLMEDQVLNMPEFLKAGCLHTNQPPTQRSKIVQCLKDGDINILLISPEALISGDSSNGFSGLFKSLPQIAFACIDEAHCVSHWSHNFRPSYLMICRVLREKLKVKCILGLTATASQTTIKSVVSHINIPDGVSGVITNPALPDNLCLSVSLEKDKDRALVAFLLTEKVSSFNSIIVYCIRRDECQRIAALLRSCLQETGKVNMEAQNKKRKRMSYIAETYHAGMSAAQRKKIQTNFINGTLRIIVATVAFGMGIDKPDIRCIIHYNMPSSFESYVQEVGRAGRDGLPALCHVLVNNSSSDINELLKHIHANSIDRPTIRKLLQKVFIPCECATSKQSTGQTLNTIACKGHEVGIPIDSTVEELDLPSENISTLLCYVELHSKQYIKVLNNAYVMCKISSYGGPQKILEAAKSCRPLAMAILMESKKDQEVMKRSVLEFNIIEAAAAVGWESGLTKYQIKNLEWITENGKCRRSHLKVEFTTLGFKIRARGDLTPTELDSILDDLHNTVAFQEKTRLHQLEECNKTFNRLGTSSVESNQMPEDNIVQKSNELKDIIRNYFQRDNCLPTIELSERPLDIDHVTADVRAIIASYKDCTFTGRSIARIFQGISSPNYPAIVWGRCKFWRSHMHEDFNGIVRLATQQIIQLKM